MFEIELRPSFEIKVGEDSESIAAGQALQDLENAIHQHPASMRDALLIYKASILPKNAEKTLEELRVEQGIELDEELGFEPVKQSVELWKLYYKLGLYRYLLAFDQETEDTLDDDHELRGFVKQLHEADERFKGQKQEIIRTARMFKFIARVVLYKLHSESSIS